MSRNCTNPHPCDCRQCKLDREKARRRRRIGYIVGTISMVAVVITAAGKVYQMYDMKENE